ncbi:hypothetical protein POM88_006502 [Heracleum sosnowskyi]|uniref:Uncharacterized protein n=1 Tax=Heracleum sosnowskyi TaxID=360622 RepID=A0AAD8J2V3_9APIA|nr:hypothetical protein POM88_006502 [Heracleum sosnowskyi]
MSLSKGVGSKTRPVLIDSMGRWIDTHVHSYLGVAACDRVRYFDTFESLYRTEGVPATTFDKREMDEAFGKFKHLDCGSTFQEEKYGRLVSRLFRIEDGYEWRMSRAGERLYDRDVEGWMAIPVSHFKAGLRLPMHKFMSDLFKYYFSAKPFYEIHWNSYTAVAKRVSGHNLFRFPKGMVNWQEEFIMVHGGDLAYLPNFELEVRNVYPSEKKGLSESVTDILERTVRSLGRVWTEVDFFENARLLEHNLLIPTRGDLPVLENATFNEPEKQREFLNAMAPRDSVNVHPPREKRGRRAVAGEDAGGVASVGRKVSRKKKSILVDEEDAALGELDASGAIMMDDAAVGGFNTSLDSDEETVAPGGEDDDDADSDTETDDGGGDLDATPAGMSEMVITSSSEDAGDGGSGGSEAEERVVVEDVLSSSEDDCREIVKEGEPVDGDTIVDRALVPFVGDAGEDAVADRAGEVSEQAEEAVGNREELEPDEVAPGGAVVKVASVRVGGRLGKKRKRAVDMVVDESRKKVKSVHEVGESSRTGSRLRLGGRLRMGGRFVLRKRKVNFALAGPGVTTSRKKRTEMAVTYSDSDEGMVVVDEETGERRPGYGYMFKSGPGSFTIDSMTEDDFQKLKGYGWSKLARRSQKYHAKSQCHFAAVLAQGDAYRLENKRLRKVELQLRNEVNTQEEYKKNVVESLNQVEADKKRFFSERHVYRNKMILAERRIEILKEQVAVTEKEKGDLATGVEKAVAETGRLAKELEYAKKCLADAESHLASRPTEEAAVRKYRASDAYKDELMKEVAAAVEREMRQRVAVGVANWKKSDDFQKSVEVAAKTLADACVFERLGACEATRKALEEEAEKKLKEARKMKRAARKQKKKYAVLRKELRERSVPSAGSSSEGEDVTMADAEVDVEAAVDIEEDEVVVVAEEALSGDVVEDGDVAVDAEIEVAEDSGDELVSGTSPSL